VPEGRCPHGGDPGACQLCAGTTNVMCVHGGDPAVCQLCNQPPVEQSGRPPTPNELAGAPYDGRSPDRPPGGDGVGPGAWDDGPRSQNPRRRRSDTPTGQDRKTYEQDAYRKNAETKHFFNPRTFINRIGHGDTCRTCDRPAGDKSVHY
jgi:hypothetical protein